MPTESHPPAYLQTHREGALDTKIEDAFDRLKSCSICPRQCAVNRLADERGFCSSGFLPAVSSHSPHFGEERPLVGRYGSGTIFFTHCNLGCSFCQNYGISHAGRGREISCQDLAQIMIELQRSGCHNINFVSPSHFVPQILKSLPPAISMGLSVPLVYNTGGYDSLDTLHLLDGIIDIYMPDFKYMDSSVAQVYSKAPDYPEMAKKALKEMFRQVGDLVFDHEGIARRGLLIRHLVLPERLAGTEEAMHFIAQNLSPDSYVNIMDQYYPCGDLPAGSPLSRRITQQEFEAAIEAARKAGLSRLDKRGKTADF